MTTHYTKGYEDSSGSYESDKSFAVKTEPTMRGVIMDFIVMTENEIQRVKTGHAPGPSMRDCIGQWASLVEDAKKVLSLDKCDSF